MKGKLIVALAIVPILLMPGLCFAIEVADAVICRGVQEREPVEPGDTFPADVGKVWCWSKIKDGKGATITHIYYYEDEQKAAVKLDVGSPLWRTYSSKRILPSWTGGWRVDIVGPEEDVLRSLEFTIGERPEPEEAPPE